MFVKLINTDVVDKSLDGVVVLNALEDHGHVNAHEDVVKGCAG